ncbi:MAG: 16S rRNA (cytosine(1402)-N(4))-methyltransferase, partial [Candidatus Eisenbacteria bacterium]|nr:16S rRNA (cytosine(1402)-N(4))-methyltransferase [Candidatus Eisenbacteria bacterium]
GGLRTTGDLTRCLRRSLGRRASPKLLASVFAAIRMATNAEIEELEDALRTMPGLLETGGVLCVISYQSQEDVRVKALRRATRQDPRTGARFRMEVCPPKLVRPSPEEARANPRARSARMRVLRRVLVNTPI